jgi:hypothetical protein
MNGDGINEGVKNTDSYFKERELFHRDMLHKLYRAPKLTLQLHLHLGTFGFWT